jgi:hypothetical protein
MRKLAKYIFKLFWPEGPKLFWLVRGVLLVTSPAIIKLIPSVWPIAVIQDWLTWPIALVAIAFIVHWILLWKAIAKGYSLDESSKPRFSIGQAESEIRTTPGKTGAQVAGMIRITNTGKTTLTHCLVDVIEIKSSVALNLAGIGLPRAVQILHQPDQGNPSGNFDIMSGQSKNIVLVSRTSHDRDAPTNIEFANNKRHSLGVVQNVKLKIGVYCKETDPLTEWIDVRMMDDSIGCAVSRT